MFVVVGRLLCVALWFVVVVRSLPLVVACCLLLDIVGCGVCFVLRDFLIAVLFLLNCCVSLVDVLVRRCCLLFVVRCLAFTAFRLCIVLSSLSVLCCLLCDDRCLFMLLAVCWVLAARWS